MLIISRQWIIRLCKTQLHDTKGRLDSYMTSNTTDLMIQVLGRDIKPHNLNQSIFQLLIASLLELSRLFYLFLHFAVLGFFNFVATSLQLLLKKCRR